MTTEQEKLAIRMADISDAEALLAIYEPYVLESAISFEYTVPDIEEFKGRMKKVLQRYPYLVAEEDGQIVGYAYASAFHEREAYDWSVEASIYLKTDCRGKGYGKCLYHALEEMLKRQNILNVNACIAYAEEEDQYLTNASQRFHERMGYRLVGKFTKSGYKFGKWYDMIWMEKLIGEHTANPKSPRIL